jgi:hypothetical protein
MNEAAHFPLQLFLRSVQSQTPRVNDNVPSATDFRQPQPQHFPDPPPGPVPPYGLTERSRHRETQPWTLFRGPIQLETEG